MGSCVFPCDVPHQWMAQRQVGPVCVYCDGVVCHVLCLRHGIFWAAHWSKYYCYKQAPSRYDLRCFKAMLNPNKPALIKRTTSQLGSVYMIWYGGMSCTAPASFQCGSTVQSVIGTPATRVHRRDMTWNVESDVKP